MHQYKRSTQIGTIDGKPAIAYTRCGDARKGEPSTVIYWQKFGTSEHMNMALFNPKKEFIIR
jgi:hypothetical protein